jgi:hypothetical protein
MNTTEKVLMGRVSKVIASIRLCGFYVATLRFITFEEIYFYLPLPISDSRAKD